MRACPAREGKGACACSLNRFPTSGFGRRSREVHRGGTGSKPNGRPFRLRGASMNHQAT